jgi:hypothetical protein
VNQLRRFALVVCGLLLGCLLELSEKAEPTSAVNGCQSTVECPQTARCTLGACVSDDPPEDLFRIRLRPSQGSDFEILDIVDIRLERSGVKDLETIRVPSPIKTSGSVRTVDGTNIEADIIAIAGREGDSMIRVESTTSRQGNVSTFQMTLPTQIQTMSGTSRPIFFDLAILPHATDSIPPFNIMAVQSTSLSPPYFIDLPATTELHRVQGRVLYNLTDRLPVAGITAMLTDTMGRRISTMVQTEPDGRFELIYWAQDTDLIRKLVIQSASMNLPRVEVPLTLESSEPVEVLQPLTLNLESQFIDWTGSIIGSEGLANTSIVAVTQLNAGRISASVTASDLDGSFQMRLIPAQYLFQITPPIDSPFGMLRAQVDVSQTTSEILRPPLKTSFTGALTDIDGRSIPDANVSATLLMPDFGDSTLVDPKLQIGERVSRSSSDSNGVFDLLLEPGSYLFTITPPVSSGLPSFVKEVTCPRTTGTPVFFSFVAPLAHVITLRLVDTADVAIANELVQVWHQETSRQIASARSNENGYVLIRLPTNTTTP